MIFNYFAVAIGGALGSVGRYWMTVTLNRHAEWLPLGTLGVNVIGSFVIGVSWAYFQQRFQNELLALFLTVGVLGGFTTFSTFSLDTIHLLGSGETMRALINIGLNVIICLCAAAAGVALGRWGF